MNEKKAILTAGAVALSTSAVQVELIGYMMRKGLLTEEEVREIYESALLLLEQTQGDDNSGVFETARELIERHLRPTME